MDISTNPHQFPDHLDGIDTRANKSKKPRADVQGISVVLFRLYTVDARTIKVALGTCRWSSHVQPENRVATTIVRLVGFMEMPSVPSMSLECFCQAHAMSRSRTAYSNRQ